MELNTNWNENKMQMEVIVVDVIRRAWVHYNTNRETRPITVTVPANVLYINTRMVRIVQDTATHPEQLVEAEKTTRSRIFSTAFSTLIKETNHHHDTTETTGRTRRT